ncbi:MAG: DNA-directed RNA polymerase subunit alpha [Planctomycetota bacterium]
MRIRWRNFELPSKVQPDRETLSKSYGRFVIEPFERGFGHTIGTGLRRVLLSSISGAAVTSVRIAGANHEFDSLEGVYEDIADLILNLKQLRIQYDGDHPIICKIRRNGEGDVTGADVECPGEARVANPNLHLCSLTMDRELEIDLEVKRGRGYVSAEENREETQELGTIPVDSIYSPVHRVRYAIEATRVGKFTNYDRLVLEIWTDGTLTPELALTEAAKIYRKHLNPFVLYDVNPGARPARRKPVDLGVQPQQPKAVGTAGPSEPADLRTGAFGSCPQLPGRCQPAHPDGLGFPLRERSHAPEEPGQDQSDRNQAEACRARFVLRDEHPRLIPDARTRPSIPLHAPLGGGASKRHPPPRS